MPSSLQLYGINMAVIFYDTCPLPYYGTKLITPIKSFMIHALWLITVHNLLHCKKFYDKG
jgi:hypothetical protein